MWSTSGLERRQTEADRPRWPLHQPLEVLDGQREPVEELPESESTGINSPNNGVASRSEGTWGERDAGGPVNQRMAMEDYEALRRELTTLSKTRSKDTGKDGGTLSRVQTGGSATARKTETRGGNSLEYTTTTATDVERGDAEDDEDDFELDQFMREGHFEKRKDGHSAKKVGVLFKNL